MRLTGMIVSTRKLMLIFVMLIVGLSLILGGLMTFYFDNQRFADRITDEEIIERARKLGMIDLKEYLESQPSENPSEAPANP